MKRYMLTSHPADFMKQPEVAALLRTPEGIKSLPVTVVNGQILTKGVYPTLAEISASLQVEMHNTRTKLSGYCALMQVVMAV